MVCWEKNKCCSKWAAVSVEEPQGNSQSPRCWQKNYKRLISSLRRHLIIIWVLNKNAFFFYVKRLRLLTTSDCILSPYF